MPWTIDEIRRDWLLDGQVAPTDASIVTAFNRVESFFGRAWIDEGRGAVWGAGVTLDIVKLGEELAALGGVDAADFIEALRAHDQAARAELTAMAVLRDANANVSIELYPPADDGRVADFRIRQNAGPFTYVEVTRPDVSEAQARAQALLATIIVTVQQIRKAAAIEVFLRRAPTDDEAAQIAQRIAQELAGDGDSPPPGRHRLDADMGWLSINEGVPGLVAPQEYEGEPNVPRLGAARAIVGVNEPPRHVAVRMPYADERAELFFRREAPQLPRDAPGIIMVDGRNLPGGFRAWEPLIRRRFQPAINTRVSALSMFYRAILLAEGAITSVLEVDSVFNPHAAVPLPDWIVRTLAVAHQQGEALLHPQ